MDEIYGYCVGVVGIAPDYFWDRMSQDEVTAIYKARNEADKIGWEQTRAICYWSVVAMNGNRTYKKPADLFKLPWEKGYKKVTSKEAQDEFSNDGCKH